MNDLNSRIATIEQKVNWAKKLSKRRTNSIRPFNLSFFDWYEPWLDKYFCLKQ